MSTPEMQEEAVERIAPVRKNGGVWVRLGESEFQIPPLNFRALRELSDVIGPLMGMNASDMPTVQQLALSAKLAHAALQRNYPEMTLDQVEDRIDLANFSTVLNAVMSTSAIKRPEEAMGKDQPAP